MIKLTQQEQAKSAINKKKEMIFEDEDGFEVFEVSDDKKIQTVESGQ
jgi:hypothetical protein